MFNKINFRVLVELKTLKRFTFSGNPLRDGKFEILMKGLSESTIEYLELAYCQLKTTLALKIFFGINQTLTHLELRGNHLRENDIVALCDGLVSYTGNLIYLGLSQNPLDTIGVELLQKCFAQINFIAELDVCGCSINEYGVEHLLELLRTHKSLKSINMSTIPFTEKQGDVLINDLVTNYCICSIECRGCELTCMQMAIVKSYTDRNSNNDNCIPVDVTTNAGEQECDVDSDELWYKLRYFFIFFILLFCFSIHSLLVNNIIMICGT